MQKELQKIKNEIEKITQAHKDNARIKTLASECLQIIDCLEKGKSTERFLLKITVKFLNV